MDARRFLDQSKRMLQNDKSPEGYRSAISRAYYAAFHAAIQFLDSIGHGVREDAGGHKEAYYYLANCADDDMKIAGTDLDMLRGKRNDADYKMKKTDVETEKMAQALVIQATQLIETVDKCKSETMRLAGIKSAIQTWKRQAGRNGG